MTLPSWPQELEQPVRSGLQHQRGETRRWGGGDQGPPRVRRGISKSTETVPLVLALTPDERARFWRFYVEEAGDGAQPFIIPDFWRDGLALWDAQGGELADEDDAVLLIAASLVCLFGQNRPAETEFAAHGWRIQFDLLVLP